MLSYTYRPEKGSFVAKIKPVSDGGGVEVFSITTTTRYAKTPDGSTLLGQVRTGAFVVSQAAERARMVVAKCSIFRGSLALSQRTVQRCVHARVERVEGRLGYTFKLSDPDERMDHNGLQCSDRASSTVLGRSDVEACAVAKRARRRSK